MSHSGAEFAEEKHWPRIPAKLGQVWELWGPWFVGAATLLMGLVAAAWLGYQLWRLVLEGPPRGAIDLGQRHREVEFWFKGETIYLMGGTAVYPPGSYAMMWPFFGWLSVSAARWLWLFTTVPILYWLSRATVRESRVRGKALRWLVALIPLAMYSTGATIGNGQLTLHVIAAMLGGMLLLLQPSSNWSKDVAGAFLVLFALIKITVAAPFFWMVLFVPGRLRPALFVALGYAACTWIACSFQGPAIHQLFEFWISRAQEGAEYGSKHGGTSNIQTWVLNARDGVSNGPGLMQQFAAWLSSFSLAGMQRSVTLGVIGVLGPLVVLHRRADPWYLMGITAVVARFWVYHMWYDDLLILFPIIALLRTCSLHASDWRSSVLAVVMLVMSLPLMIAPGGLYSLPLPWKELYMGAQAFLWLAMGVFLYAQILRGKRLDGIIEEQQVASGGISAHQ